MCHRATQSYLLRRALKANAIFTSLSGLALLLLSDPIGGLLGYSNAIFYQILGIGFIAFAGYVYYLSQREEVDVKGSYGIVLADGLWVIGSVIVLLAFPAMPVAGKWAVGFIAEIVLIFAILEFIGVRRIKPRAALATE